MPLELQQRGPALALAVVAPAAIDLPPPSFLDELITRARESAPNGRCHSPSYARSVMYATPPCTSGSPNSPAPGTSCATPTGTASLVATQQRRKNARSGSDWDRALPQTLALNRPGRQRAGREPASLPQGRVTFNRPPARPAPQSPSASRRSIRTRTPFPFPIALRRVGTGTGNALKQRARCAIKKRDHAHGRSSSRHPTASTSTLWVIDRAQLASKFLRRFLDLRHPLRDALLHRERRLFVREGRGGGDPLPRFAQVS